MLRTVIIDDEKNSRELLRTFLQKYTEDVEIVDEAESIDTGIHIINKNKPDLVFLDIELTGGTGFELLDKLKETDFMCCFVTGYSEYAIKAIKYNAFDYLLKPLDKSELISVIDKAKSRVSHEEIPHKSLFINESGRIQIIEIDEIEFLAANGNYTIINMVDNKKVVSSESLVYFEDVLPCNAFCRIHKSHIIHLSQIKELEMGRTGTVFLNSGQSLPIASRRKKECLEKLKKYMEENDTFITF